MKRKLKPKKCPLCKKEVYVNELFPYKLYVACCPTCGYRTAGKTRENAIALWNKAKPFVRHCPFCDKKPKTKTYSVNVGDLILFACENSKCPVEPNLHEYLPKIEAIKRWNNSRKINWTWD